MGFGIEAADIRERVAPPDNHVGQPMSPQEMIERIRRSTGQAPLAAQPTHQSAIAQEFPSQWAGVAPSYDQFPLRLPEDRVDRRQPLTIEPVQPVSTVRVRDSDSKQFIGYLAARLGPQAWRSLLAEYQATFSQG